MPRTTTRTWIRRGETTTRDDSGQISSWLVKLVLSVAIVGFLLIEVGAVAINRFQASDIAGQAATEAGLVYAGGGDAKRAEERAEDVVVQNDAVFVSFDVAGDRESVSVTVEKVASTIVVDRIDAISQWATVQVTETAPIRE